jgi:HlyD family secretion protein
VKKRVALIIFLALLIGVGAFVYYAQRAARNGEMYYSGTIEATDSNLSFQVSGHVTAVYSREGRAVGKGEVLAELDRPEFQARLDQAKAALDRAVQTKAQLFESLAIYQGSLPADVKRAEAGLKVAQYNLSDTKKNADRYEELFRRGVVSERERDSVRLAYDNASSRLDEATAALKVAKSNLGRIDSAKRDIEVAQAQIDQAKAALDQVQIQLGYTRLAAPYAGVIVSRNVEPGEVVSPGREVFTLSDLSRVDLKVFVDETDIGRVKPGQKVKVKVDAFPGKFFSGNVSYISPEAEFTPKVIQTKKERVKLVYLVKVSIPNPRYELKTGMPADAYLK